MLNYKFYQRKFLTNGRDSREREEEGIVGAPLVIAGSIVAIEFLVKNFGVDLVDEGLD